MMIKRNAGLPKAGLFLVMLVAIILAAAWAVRSWLDDTVRTEVAAALLVPSNSLPPENNLFFALLGAASRGDHFIVARGRALFEKYRAAGNKKHSALIPLEERLVWRGELAALCPIQRHRDAPSCLLRLLNNPIAVRLLVSQNDEALDRYLQLHAFSKFENPIEPSLYADQLPWQYLIQAMRLNLTRILIGVDFSNAHERARMIQSWRSDLDFWKILLSEMDDSLVGKMVAVRAMTEHFQFAGDLLRHPLVNARDARFIEHSLQAFSEGALSMRDAMLGEFRLLNSLISTFEDPNVGVDRLMSADKGIASLEQAEQAPSSWLSRAVMPFFFLPNNTRHLIHDQIMSVMDRRKNNSCPIAGVQAPAPPPEPGFFSMLKNPIGQVLGNIAAPDYDSYFDRLCDLEGIRRVLLIHARVRADHLDETQVAGFVQNQHAALYDPYTDQPMRWSTAPEGITFSARSKETKESLPWPL